MSLYDDDGGAPYPPVDRTEPCFTTGDPEVFFPEGSGAHAADPARELCADCHVRQACLDYALTHGVLGVWAGTTEPERRRMRRELNITAVPVVGGSAHTMIIRAGGRGMPLLAIAALAEIDAHTVGQVLAKHRRQTAGAAP